MCCHDRSSEIPLPTIPKVTWNKKMISITPEEAMLGFLKGMMHEVRAVFRPDLSDPDLQINIVASLPETAPPRTVKRFRELLLESWSCFGHNRAPTQAKVTAEITREPFAAVLAMQYHREQDAVSKIQPGQTIVSRRRFMLHPSEGP